MALETAMTFAWPHLLWLLALPAALLFRELRRRRRFAAVEHPKILRAEAGLRSVSLSPEDAPPAPLSRRRILLCAGLALGIVALARPQWGKLDQPVFDQSREIIIALDLSRSMTTPDVKPTRLDRAKLLIQSLLDRLSGERVGLIVFSGTAFLQAPASPDYEILREFLPALGPDYLPEGGTNYEQLIDTALDAFGGASAADRYLIILSDGEATDDDWRSRVPELAKRGIRVIGLGVGTAHGAMIPDGSGGFMKDENGAVVMSKLESGTLRELAGATHGAYRDASEWIDLPALLASTVEEGRRGRFVEVNSVRYVERYQWALAQALVCLLASFWLEFPVAPKPRDIRLSGPAAAKARSASALAAACMAALLLAFGARAATPQEPPDAAALLSRIVGRLSSQESCSALDWAEMANQTVTWGQHLLSSSQAVPERPVRDALAAVDLGERADPKAADWVRIRSDLEKLLEKPEDKKPPQNQDKNQDQNQDSQQKQDQKQDQKQEQQQSQNQDQQQGAQPQSGGPKGSGNEPQRRQEDANRAKEQSAFGNMGAPPTPTPGAPEHKEKRGAAETQKVGGAKKDQNDPALRDPGLAVSLEKLEKLKSEDSPAELFDLMRRGEPIPTPVPNAKNW